MLYIISNERTGISKNFTNKKDARKEMTAIKKTGCHFTVRVHDAYGCKASGVDAIRYISRR